MPDTPHSVPPNETGRLKNIEDTKQLVVDKIKIANRGYNFWIVVYGVLGLGSVIGAGLAATGLCPTITLQISAAVSTICGLIVGFVKPHTYATAFDQELSMLRKIQNGLVGGRLTLEQATEQLNAAEDLAHFRYTEIQGQTQK